MQSTLFELRYQEVSVLLEAPRVEALTVGWLVSEAMRQDEAFMRELGDAQVINVEASTGFEIDLDVKLVLLGDDARELTVLTQTQASYEHTGDRVNVASGAEIEAYETEIGELKQRVFLLEQTVAALQANLLTSMQYELEKAKQVCFKYVDDKMKRMSLSAQSPISSPSHGLRGFLNTISEDEELEEEDFANEEDEDVQLPGDHKVDTRTFGTHRSTDEQIPHEEFATDFVRTGPARPLEIQLTSNGSNGTTTTTESIAFLTTPPRNRIKSALPSWSEPLPPRQGSPRSSNITAASVAGSVATAVTSNNNVREMPDGHMRRTESDDMSVASSHTTNLSVDDDGLVMTEDYETLDWDANSPENVLLTRFWKACATGPVEHVDAILQEWKINVNSANRTGFTALHQAAHAGQAEVVEYLLKSASANAMAVAGMGWTPLHLAASAGQEQVVQILLNSMRKFKYSVPDKLGCTAMMIAARENHQGVVDILKAAGAKK